MVFLREIQKNVKTMKDMYIKATILDKDAVETSVFFLEGFPASFLAKSPDQLI